MSGFVGFFKHFFSHHLFSLPFLPSGALAFSGHEVRIHDNNNVILNKVYLRLSEDKRILKEDGLIAHTNFLVRDIHL